MVSILTSTGRYYHNLLFGDVLVNNGDVAVRRVHTTSLKCTTRIWDRPHYRAKSMGQDIRNNLRNVAIPGTGIPLSLFCLHKRLAELFLLFIYPPACLIAALYLRSVSKSPIGPTYEQLLHAPRHWFAIWRMNCVVVAYHALLTNSKSYDMEDKGTFLLEAPKLGISVSPLLDVQSIVVKHKNIEGGMAIHFYRNFQNGGDWIIQPALRNSAFLCSLLPKNAPLSTLRIITASYRGLQQLNAPVTQQELDHILVATVVFRAGLAGASTDHTSICFDVDRNTGVIHTGVSNQHWYKLGLAGLLRVHPTAFQVHTHHPDSKIQITGQRIPDFEAVRKLVCDAHDAMVPDVPLVGWDVALTDEGACLLEMNISCNFFNGSYDRAWYEDFVTRYLAAAWKYDDEQKAEGGVAGGKRQ